MNNLKYPKDLISELEYKDNLVNKAFSTPLLINYSFKSYFKNRNKTTTL